MNEIVLATRNAGKVKEIKDILSDLSVKILTLSDFPELPDVIEDGKTFQENALKKARVIFQATSIPTLSDDSGLEVFQLGMEPGVLSARYAGEKVSYEANNEKLLQKLKGVPLTERSAQFTCVVALIGLDINKTSKGICRGRIIDGVRGQGGFGYDPLFVPNGFDKTFAELSNEIKNRISHRAIALNGIKPYLKIIFQLI